MKSKKSVAIIGAGPAGCMSAYQLLREGCCNVTLFDTNSPLKTLLHTGGGRCNIAYAEFDFKELVKHYPRGEKFLLSVFSQFGVNETIDFMESIGVKTYTQDDKRIFPKSNSARDMRDKFLSAISDAEIKNEKVETVKKTDNGFIINDKYEFSKVIIATGGHANYQTATSLGHKIVEPKPALMGLVTYNNYKNPRGLSIKSAKAQVMFDNQKVESPNFELKGDFIFTHYGISGPLVYMISSLCARMEYSEKNPLFIRINFLDSDIDFQKILNDNPKKYVKNIISDFVPKTMAEYILRECKINDQILCHEINKEKKQAILEQLTAFDIIVTGHELEGEIVTAGGVDLDEINSKTMESKIVKGLYFCGEVINVDGFCGGFNLQNCWSTGYIAGKNAAR